MSFAHPEVALENMVILRDVLAQRGIEAFLNFGTLLGALRERDFIPHDHDVDMGIRRRDYDRFLQALPDLAGRGLALGNVWGDKRCYSFFRDGEQLDVFIAFEHRSLLGPRWDLDGKVTIAGRHLDSLDDVDFRGQPFKVPHDPTAVLLRLYGKTWTIPIDGKVSHIDVLSRVRAALRSPGKTLLYVPTFIGNRIKWALAARRTNHGGTGREAS